jgi:hypothetical protein
LRKPSLMIRRPSQTPLLLYPKRKRPAVTEIHIPGRSDSI